MLSILNRSGVWRLAGMSGTVYGLDLREAMASLPAGCDRDRMCRLFLIGEREFVTAARKAAEKNGDRPDGRQ